MSPVRGAKWGKDFKTITVALTMDEHKEAKMQAAKYDVSISDVCRLALGDAEMWKRAAAAKDAAKSEGNAEGNE